VKNFTFLAKEENFSGFIDSKYEYYSNLFTGIFWGQKLKFYMESHEKVMRFF